MEKKKVEYNDDLKVINTYMKDKKIDVEIQGKVRAVFESL